MRSTIVSILAFACLISMQPAVAQTNVQQQPLGERLGAKAAELMEMQRLASNYASTDYLAYDVAISFADSANAQTILEQTTASYRLYDGLFWGFQDSVEYVQGQQYYLTVDHPSKIIYVDDKLTYSRLLDVPLTDTLFNEAALKNISVFRPGGVFKRLVLEYFPGFQYKMVEFVYDSTSYLVSSIAYFQNAVYYPDTGLCESDSIFTVPSTGVPLHWSVSPSSLATLYRNFVIEFPGHLNGGNVNVWDVSLGAWKDSIMTGYELFRWYMNAHINNAGYTPEVYLDWIVNIAGCKLYQKPWGGDVNVRQDTLSKIWNDYLNKYPGSSSSINETIDIPMVKGMTSNSSFGLDYLNSDDLTVSVMDNGFGWWEVRRYSNVLDISGIPRNAVINSATLNLYANNYSGAPGAHYRHDFDNPYMLMTPVRAALVPDVTSALNIPPQNIGNYGTIYPYPPYWSYYYYGMHDMYSDGDALGQDAFDLIFFLHYNASYTGVNFPVLYVLSDESPVYNRVFQFGGPECYDQYKRPQMIVNFDATREEVFVHHVNKALGTKLSATQIKDLYKYRGKLDINTTYTAATPGVGCGTMTGQAMTGKTTFSFTPLPGAAMDTDLFGEARFITNSGSGLVPAAGYQGYTIVNVRDNQ